VLAFVLLRATCHVLRATNWRMKPRHFAILEKTAAAQKDDIRVAVSRRRTGDSMTIQTPPRGAIQPSIYLCTETAESRVIVKTHHVTSKLATPQALSVDDTRKESTCTCTYVQLYLFSLLPTGTRSPDPAHHNMHLECWWLSNSYESERHREYPRIVIQT